jgi:hypothetical protein
VDTPTTRRALHGVAELLLAGPQYRRTGTIRLLVSPGGFRTVKEPEIRVEGVELVAAGRRIPIAGRSCAELAASAGLDVGAPHGLYHDGSGVDPDEPLALDAEDAHWLASCWAAGDAALRRLYPDQQPILWPEHFDVGIRADATNYGVSPGDDFLPEPYAYVTPPAPRTGTFWTAPFGAARPVRDLGATPDALLAWFREGRDRAGTDPGLP